MTEYPNASGSWRQEARRVPGGISPRGLTGTTSVVDFDQERARIDAQAEELGAELAAIAHVYQPSYAARGTRDNGDGGGHQGWDLTQYHPDMTHMDPFEGFR